MPELTSNAGYANEADKLAIQYEKLRFEDTQADLIPFLPAPGLAIDIGAGTGRDVGWLAAHGWTCVAVEPTAELRAHAQRLHPDPAITWIDDGLPTLASLQPYAGQAQMVLMTAVWMHLTREERVAAMPRLAELLAPGGILAMTVRHGPVPEGRRMFEIADSEVLADAIGLGLTTVQHNDRRADTQARPGVFWSRFIFRR
ncbi:class I SAM-dependent methyltransferase [Lacibacterium aquatile]|uniref:Class I SAM-dependent methyltransferase n=1 Tax=Lacibacterium aquatile TaxID=1168082 RepID=A0ABW5DZR9_9PROT